MAGRFCGMLSVGLTLAFWLIWPGSGDLLAQDREAMEAAFKLRPGGYLSMLKIGLVAFVFLIWVWAVDWINRDALKFGKKSGLRPEFWNPIIVVFFLVTFVAVISVPLFWAGFPVYVLGATIPPIAYVMARRSKLKENQSLQRAVLKSKGKEELVDEVLPQDEGAEITFSPAGDDATSKQRNLIQARQAGFTELKNLMFDAQFKRAEQLLMDYTRDMATVRILVDGTWHPLEPMNRETGDALLASLKNLAGLNPAERRAKQSSRIGVKSEHGKGNVEVTSQGTQTGERVLVRFESNLQEAQPLDALGMLPEMYQKVRDALNHPGLTIISAPPGQGLTTSWQGALMSADRLTRDCIGFIDHQDNETGIENIVVKHYDVAERPQHEELKAILLTQPDMLAVPKVEEKETMDLLVTQANTQQRAIAFRTPARSAAEAFLRVYAQAGDRNEFLKAARVATCQRLARRLCPTCRTEVRVQPQMIQKLGGNPQTQGSIFNQYQLPPPEQRVDENGNPIEIPPCETCGGIGYIGRIAIFEMLEITDALRDVIRKTPQPAAVEAAAVKLGKKTLAQQAYQLVLLGATSLAEVQRVLNEKK